MQSKYKLEVFRASLFLFLFALMPSCIDMSTEWSIDIEKQKIEGSNICIYKFDAWGGRDSHVSGVKLIDSLRGFKHSDVMIGNDFEYLMSIPNKDTVIAARIALQENHEGEIVKPISVSFRKIGEIVLKTITYPYDRSITGICTLKSYKFKRFKETRDSIVFFQNESIFTNGKDFDRISIPKGNITLINSRDSERVAKIVYEDLIVFDDLSESGGIQICQMTKYFTPVNEVYMSEFSDYGLYRSVEYEDE